MSEISLTTSTLACSRLPCVRLPYPSALATPSCGGPDDGVSVNRLFPTGCRPALLMKRVRPIWPMMVDVVSEMSDLIAAQRAYEMNAKVVSAADQMMQTTSALFR